MDKKILIIDDCPFFLTTLRDLLQNSFTVTSASSGEKAIDLLQDKYEDRTPYDLVVTDLNMPGISGYEVAKYVRGKNRSHKFTPVIMLTEMDISTEEAREHGCAAYVPKSKMNKIKSLSSILTTN